ncbi:MAG: TolC family protein, partial [Novosphingobium sp.]|nr:TolC family protein [Novosphingobium sp.]
MTCAFRLRRLALLGMVALSGGCSHADDPHRAPRMAYLQTLPASFDDPEQELAALSGGTGPSEASPLQATPTPARWWKSASDPALDSLLATAAVANNDILTGAARLAQARALRGAARAAQLPRIDAAIGATRNDAVRGAGAGNGGGTLLSAQIDLGWDPDLFGRLRKDSAAARADLAAAGFDAENLQRVVRLEVIRTYVTLRAVEARLGFVALSMQRQQDILDMVEKRYQLGISVETDRQQARLQLLQVRALEPQLRNDRNQLRNRLAVLTGVASAALDPLLEKPGGIPVFAAPAGLGIPADVVRLRPDVRAAENRLLAAGERIGAARAALLPQLSLGATLSTAAPSPAGLFDTIIAQTVGRIAQSLFAGGAQKAAVARSRAIADEALASYRGTI